jgi:hypothetical protein
VKPVPGMSYQPIVNSLEAAILTAAGLEGGLEFLASGSFLQIDVRPSTTRRMADAVAARRIQEVVR